eukprot:11622339-Heterocapsa_arctica.AAC.1
MTAKIDQAAGNGLSKNGDSHYKSQAALVLSTQAAQELDKSYGSLDGKRVREAAQELDKSYGSLDGKR